jgi:hypothetical protein
VRLFLCILAISVAIRAYGGDVPGSFFDAQVDWKKNKDSPEYQTYTSEFVQFNNHFHIDEKSGCYALGKGEVTLMLVIGHDSGTEFADVKNVFSDSDSQKARCFVNAYRGLKTKVPPYVPFVLQMGFE